MLRQISLKKIFSDNLNYVGIAPGAGEENKIWPLNNYIEIGKYLELKDYKIVFYLGPNEKDYVKVLKENFQNAIFLENEKLLFHFLFSNM